MIFIVIFFLFFCYLSYIYMGGNMETNLNNTVSVLGNYNNIPTSVSSQVLVVSMIDGLTVTKSADKMIWADGVLTYTVVVDNKTTESYTSPVITDVLDISLVSFVSGSVTVDGEKLDESKYTYAEDTGALIINLSDILPSSSSTVTFQVTKKA